MTKIQEVFYSLIETAARVALPTCTRAEAPEAACFVVFANDPNMSAGCPACRVKHHLKMVLIEAHNHDSGDTR